MLTSYRDALPLKFRREIRLFDDHVEGETHWIRGTSASWNLKYSEIVHYSTVYTIRRRSYKVGMWIVGLGFCLLVMAIVQALSGGAGHANQLRDTSLVAGGMAVFGGALMYFSRKRIQIAYFQNAQRKVLLDVVSHGPDSERFEEFVTLLRQKVAAAQA